METNYLILGAGHAGLSALESIRRYDQASPLTIVTMEKDHVYSPTALPYVISGRTSKGFIDIRSDEYFRALDVDLIKHAAVTRLDTENNQVILNGNTTVQYRKCVIATGAAASLPPIPGLDEIDSFCIRTLKDAAEIKAKKSQAESVIIIGAGFIGMRAAEDLAGSGLAVTVVEAIDRVMPANFDRDASAYIHKTFADNGITILTGTQVARAWKHDGQSVLLLSSGDEIAADMVIVATGISPNTDFLEGTDIAREQGILVDERMRTSVANVWAAGDVAMAPGFFSSDKSIGGTIPSATEQGKTAGMDMVQDHYASDYPGNLNMNTFSFFNNFAFSIGNVADPSACETSEIHSTDDPSAGRFSKFIFQDNVLTGVSAINTALDPGILKQLILNRTDLSTRKEAFINTPLEVGRQLMRELF